VAFRAWRIPGRIDAGRGVGGRQDGAAIRLYGVLASGVEFVLQIQLQDLHIAHGHADIAVSQQLHESREAHPEADRLRG
jgi:hypothetical protein